MLTARLNVGSFVVSDDENLDDLESSVQHLGSPSVNSAFGKKSSIDTPVILKKTAAILKETPAVLKTQNSRNEMVKNDSIRMSQFVRLFKRRYSHAFLTGVQDTKC